MTEATRKVAVNEFVTVYFETEAAYNDYMRYENKAAWVKAFLDGECDIYDLEEFC